MTGQHPIALGANYKQKLREHQTKKALIYQSFLFAGWPNRRA
jgi:hypothetical protein